jgi:hypothetical protein
MFPLLKVKNQEQVYLKELEAMLSAFESIKTFFYPDGNLARVYFVAKKCTKTEIIKMIQS